MYLYLPHCEDDFLENTTPIYIMNVLIKMLIDGIAIILT